MKRVLFISVIFAIIFCQKNPELDVVSINEKKLGCYAKSAFDTTSSAGLLKYLAKQTLVDTTDSISYCSAEKLYWVYDTTEYKLQLLHTRKYYNCGSKIIAQIIKEEDGNYRISEELSPDQDLALCCCPYDFYYEMPVTDSFLTMKVLYYNSYQYYQILISQKSGVFNIDTTFSTNCVQEFIDNAMRPPI